MGGGKTEALLYDAIQYALTYPGSFVGLFRRTFPELNMTFIRRALIALPDSLVQYNKSEHTITFAPFLPTSSKILFGYSDSETDIIRYQSAEFDYIGIDELTHWSEFQYLFLLSRLRSVHGYPVKIRTASNPGSIGHLWVKERFRIGDVLPEKIWRDPDSGMTRCFIPSKVYDNPALMKADPGYIKRLQNLPEAERRAFIEGDWNIFVGQALKEWRYDRHVTVNFDYLLSQCRKFIGFDWGYNAPGAAVWLAQTPDLRIYAYRELYQNQKTPQEWAEDIIRLSGNELIEEIILPHDCFSKLGGWDSVAEVFRRNKVAPIRHGQTLSKDMRKNRLAITHQFLADAPDGRPWFQVHYSLTNTIRTLPSLVYAKNNPEDIDCFVAGTLIATPEGERPIETIRIGDEVLTPVGPRKVTKSGIETRSPVTKVSFSDGRQLIGTSNHKVFVQGKGLVALHNLQCNDTLEVWNRQSQKQSPIGVFDIVDMLDAAITRLSVVSIWLPGIHSSIVRFISIILVQFLPDIMSIIRTTILTIMYRLIFGLSVNENMRYFTTESVSHQESCPICSLAGEKLGTVNESCAIMRVKCENELQSGNYRALLVGRMLRHNRRQRNSVVHVWINRVINYLNVRFAEKISGEDLLVRNQREPVRIVAVGNYGVDAVYKLTVAGAHLYYANGFLATNTDGEDHLFDAISTALVIRRGSHQGSGELSRDRFAEPDRWIANPDGTLQTPDFWAAEADRARRGYKTADTM